KLDASKQEVQDLRKSVARMQNIVEERDTLQQQNAELRKQNEELSNTVNALRQMCDDKKNTIKKEEYDSVVQKLRALNERLDEEITAHQEVQQQLKEAKEKNESYAGMAFLSSLI